MFIMIMIDNHNDKDEGRDDDYYHLPLYRMIMIIMNGRGAVYG